MTADHGYTGFPRYTGPEQGWTVYPPKDESWRDGANCMGMDAELFFPSRGDDYAEAKKVCRACDCQAACLEYALTPPVERWGCWGGTSEQERREIRKARWSA